MKHCMVDIETLGTKPGSVILSIGAVMFDAESGIGNSFYCNIDPISCKAAGLTVDVATVEWWKKQSQEAIAALQADRLLVGEALLLFRNFWNQEGAEFIWSNGANFDEVLLQAAYSKFEQVSPWKYWGVRCCRTILALAGIKPDRSVGVAHNALADARAQAEAVIIAFKKLGLS